MKRSTNLDMKIEQIPERNRTANQTKILAELKAKKTKFQSNLEAHMLPIQELMDEMREKDEPAPLGHKPKHYSPRIRQTSLLLCTHWVGVSNLDSTTISRIFASALTAETSGELMVFHAIVDRALNGDTLILALLKKSVTAVQAVSADISIRAGWEVTKNALKASQWSGHRCSHWIGRRSLREDQKDQVQFDHCWLHCECSIQFALQVSAQSMSAKLMAAPEIVAYVPACVASYQGGGAFMLKYTPCPAVFSGSVDMKDPTDTSAYSKSSNEMLNLLSEAKTYEVYFRSGSWEQQKPFTTRRITSSTQNMFWRRPLNSHRSMCQMSSLEYSEKEAAAMVCGLYTHTKKLEVSELFSVAISMDHHYGHLSHSGLCFRLPRIGKEDIFIDTCHSALQAPLGSSRGSSCGVQPASSWHFGFGSWGCKYHFNTCQLRTFSQRMGMPTHDYRISPAVAESAGIVEVFRVCALEQFDSDYNLVRATIKNMGELGGSLTNYRLAFQSYLTGLDTAMTDFARRLVDKRREVRMAIADQEARAASQQAVGN